MRPEKKFDFTNKNFWIYCKTNMMKNHCQNSKNALKHRKNAIDFVNVISLTIPESALKIFDEETN